MPDEGTCLASPGTPTVGDCVGIRCRGRRHTPDNVAAITVRHLIRMLTTTMHGMEYT